MATKTLNTRIKLRYDLYANWVSVNPVLYAGELAISNVPAESASGLTEPCVAIKCGDGTSAYKDLPFITALAGDVLTACKTEAGLKEFVNNVITEAGIATSTDLEALTDRVTVNETDIAALKELVGTAKVEDAVADAVQDAKDYTDEQIAAKVATTYKASGSVASADDLPRGSASTLGNVYNVSADFETTDDFIEGAGKTVPAGSNVVIVETAPGVSNVNRSDEVTITVDGATVNFSGVTINPADDLNTAYGVTVGASSKLECELPSGGVFSFNVNASTTVADVVTSLNKSIYNFGWKATTEDNKLDFLYSEDGTYAYDVVGSFIDLSNYMTKDETTDAINTAKQEVLDAIPNEVEKALTPTVDPDDPTGTPTNSPLLDKVEEIITNEIANLDFADTAVDGQFVTAVSQEDGLISVVRKALEAADIPDLTSEKITDIVTKIESVMTDALTPPADGSTSTIYETLTEKITEIVTSVIAGDGGSDGDDLSKTIQDMIDAALKDAGTPADPGSGQPEVPGSTLNQTVNQMITSKIEDLDVADTGVDGEWVWSVSQTDGLISVVRKALAVSDLPDAIPTDKIDKLSEKIVEVVIENTQEPTGGNTNPNYDTLVENITTIIEKELEKQGTAQDPNTFYDSIKEIVEQMVNDMLNDAGGDDDGQGGTTAPSVLNTTVNNIVDDKLSDLTVTDTLEATKVVQTVQQADGKVSFTKVELAPVAFSGLIEDLEQDPDDELIWDCGGAGA